MATDNPPAYTEAGPSPSSSHAVGDIKQNPSLNQKTLALLVFSNSDRLRFIRFPEPLKTLASEVIQKHWPQGIQRVQVLDEGFDFKLKGNPLCYGSDGDRLATRHTLNGLFEAFAKEGWTVAPAGRIGRPGSQWTSGAKESIVFQYTEPRPSSCLCISFLAPDVIHMINGTTELAQALITSFGERIKQCKRDFVSGNFEITFTGASWSTCSKLSQVILLDLLQCLQAQGYTLSTSVDLDGEIWFCYLI